MVLWMSNPFVYYAVKSPHVKIEIRKIISFNRRSDVSKSAEEKLQNHPDTIIMVQAVISPSHEKPVETEKYIAHAPTHRKSYTQSQE